MSDLIGNPDNRFSHDAAYIFQLKLGNDVIDYAVGDTSGDDELSSFDSLLLEERKDLDFTDHLWKVRYSSYTVHINNGQ